MDLLSPIKKPAKRNRSKSIHISNPVALEEYSDSEDDFPDYCNTINSTQDIDSDSSTWNSEDERELVNNIKKSTIKNDKLKYKTRMAKLDWDAIAFKKYSAVECLERFKKYVKCVRRVRNLNEIVDDVEAHINRCPIKKPLNSYQIFIKDQLSTIRSCGDFTETMTNMATMYKALTPEEREKYEHKAKQFRMEYFIKKREFLKENPKTESLANNERLKNKVKKLQTPFLLFSDYNKLLGNNLNNAALREAYSNLSTDEKYNWVHKAVNLSPNADIKELLNKEEQRIFKGITKSAPTAYGLFVKEMYHTIKEECGTTTNAFRAIALKWKTLDGKKKENYKLAAQRMKEAAEEEQKAFKERHSVVETKKNIKKNIKKHNSLTITEPELPKPDENIALLRTKSKKRKNSQTTNSSAVESSDDTTKSKRIKIEKATPEKNLFPSPKKAAPAMTVIHTQLKEMEPERKKNKSSKVIQESDTDASTSSGNKKKEKKAKRSSEIQPPLKKPPSTLLQYFTEQIHTGKAKKAEKAFNKLSKKEKKQLNGEYSDKVESYVTQLKLYLASLSKEDAIKYITKIKEDETGNNSVQENGNDKESEDY